MAWLWCLHLRVDVPRKPLRQTTSFMSFQRWLSSLLSPLVLEMCSGIWCGQGCGHGGCVCPFPAFWQKFELDTLALLVLGSASLIPPGHPHQSYAYFLCILESQDLEERQGRTPGVYLKIPIILGEGCLS